MDTSSKSKPRSSKSQEKPKNRVDIKWVLKVFVVSIAVSALLSFVSSELVNHMPIVLQFVLLLVIIGLGILFDIIGLSVATADEKKFHSMAARKLKEGKIAVAMIRNADKLSSICNDVVGDICGIVSGATAASIALRVFTDPEISFFGNLMITALVSGMTIGGKAIGKFFGMNYSEDIIYAIARIAKILPMEFGKK